ncbi:hypothetical protein FACS189449_05030 [Alphaproteobacteria bacterium]|nr:hypothetical protein FACS189449_05030 [Alphaproteobacteria bacterium]
MGTVLFPFVVRMVVWASKPAYNQEFNMHSDQFKNFIGVDVSKDKIDIFSSLDGKQQGFFLET